MTPKPVGVHSKKFTMCTKAVDQLPTWDHREEACLSEDKPVRRLHRTS